MPPAQFAASSSHLANAQPFLLLVVQDFVRASPVLQEWPLIARASAVTSVVPQCRVLARRGVLLHSVANFPNEVGPRPGVPAMPFHWTPVGKVCVRFRIRAGLHKI